ncbi:MAG TPA: HAMP domain-containing sensor histidine kinase [Candidatus Acidoferrales bacterium]|nr:HAMP domain-containing sensor histidine kinase [Candidatus Acidoferrales bacterium]
MKLSIASRLSAMFAVLLGVTIVVVILASAIALVLQLGRFGGDFIMARHEQARALADRLEANGVALNKAAPQIVDALSGPGLRVAVYNDRGAFLAGDKGLHPRILERWVNAPLPPPRGGPPAGAGGPPRFYGVQIRGRTGPPPSFGPVAAVDGGYVIFALASPLPLFLLGSYWWVVLGVSIVAIVISWLIGRYFAHQALRPINDLIQSLQALAHGDFTQRRFVGPTDDEIGLLTAAYNDAAAGVARAMSERRETEERMRQFVADAGHELRTPLTVIGGYIDVLRRGAIAEPTIARQILGTMSLEKEHMRGLIDRLMRLARLDSETPPRAETIDVAELLRSQCDAARRLDETREIDYSVDGAQSLVADRTELGEALWNVVENALKYAPDAPIHLRAVRNNGHTTITVRDEGPGMTESERLHAFERFYRGDQRGEITGSGLGLAIAKRAVERAGGSIGIESAPHRGTTVTITL